MPSLRKRAEEVGGAEQDSRLEAKLAEPAVKDLLHLAAAINLRQRRIDGKPQLPVAARQRDGIRLDRNVVGQQAHSLLILKPGTDQQQLVARKSVCLATVQRRNGLVAILHRKHDGVELLLAILQYDRGFVAGTGDDRNLLARDILQAAYSSGVSHHQARG